MNVKLQQQAGLPGQQQIDRFANWIFLLPHPLKPAEIKKLPYGAAIVARRKQLGNEGPDKKPVVLDLPNKNGSHVAAACVKAGISSFNLLTLARKLASAHGDYQAREIGVVVHGFAGKD